jgi:hypothetical protein
MPASTRKGGSHKMSIRRKSGRSRPSSSFGKKKRKTTKTGSKVTKRPSATLRRQAKKLRINITLKRGTKRVYKTEVVLKRQIKKKMKMKPTLKRPVKRRKRSMFGSTHRPLLISPHGPPQPWLLKDETPAYSEAPAFGMRKPSAAQTKRLQKLQRLIRRSRFGNSLEGKRVNPSGYLSTWNGFPRTPPPSWNPLLLQGNNNFREGINSPSLSNVGSRFGKKRLVR